MDYSRAAKTDAGTAFFPEAMEYRTMKIGACDLEEDQQDSYTEESPTQGPRDTALEEGSSESSEKRSEAAENWWESD